MLFKVQLNLYYVAFVWVDMISYLYQGQLIDSNYTKLRYRGPVHAVKNIFVAEGFLALYSG